MRKVLILSLSLLIAAGCGGGSGSSGSASRGLLFYNLGAGDIPLRRMPTSGGHEAQVAGATNSFVGSMTADGTVYADMAVAGVDNIYKIRNGLATKITTGAGADYRPCVTPDGSKFVYVHADVATGAQIIVANGDGSGAVNVSHGTVGVGDNWYPSISMDGSKVVFMSDRDGDSEIYLVNSDGTGLTRLTNNPADDTTPAFTPDGTHIIFESDRVGDAHEIFKMDLTGGNVTQLTSAGLDFTHASYSVDGSAIFAYDSAGIVRLPADGSSFVHLLGSGVHGDVKTAGWVYP